MPVGKVRFLFYSSLLVVNFGAEGQSLGAGTVRVMVVDPDGAAVPSAVVELANTITGFRKRPVEHLPPACEPDRLCAHNSGGIGSKHGAGRSNHRTCPCRSADYR